MPRPRPVMVELADFLLSRRKLPQGRKDQSRAKPGRECGPVPQEYMLP